METKHDGNICTKSSLHDVIWEGQCIEKLFKISPGALGIDCQGNVVSKVFEEHQAKEFGIRVGWQILDINGFKCRDWVDIGAGFKIAKTSGTPYTILFSLLRTKRLIFNGKPIGFVLAKNIIIKVIANSEADKQGVRVGWIIYRVNGDIQNSDQSKINEAIQKTQKRGQPTSISFVLQKSTKLRLTGLPYDHERFNLMGIYKETSTLVNGKRSFKHTHYGSNFFIWWHIAKKRWIVGAKASIGEDLSWLCTAEDTTDAPLNEYEGSWHISAAGSWTTTDKIKCIPVQSHIETKGEEQEESEVESFQIEFKNDENLRRAKSVEIRTDRLKISNSLPMGKSQSSIAFGSREFNSKVPKIKENFIILSMKEKLLVQQMRRTDGIPVKTRMWHFKKFERCFVGSELVAWMLKKGLAHNEGNAVRIGEKLRQKKIFEHVTSQHPFQNEYLFYRFTHNGSIVLEPKEIRFNSTDIGFRLDGNTIVNVEPTSFAARAGVKIGWVVLKVNKVKQMDNHWAIASAIRKSRSRGNPTIIVFHVYNTKEITFESRNIGIRIEGNTIVNVKSNGAATQAGVQVGWIILKVNKIKQNDDHCEIASTIRKFQSCKKSITILFQVVQKQYHMEFSPNSIDPWGCTFNTANSWSEWIIINVDEGKQAERIGVKIGDKIVAVNGEPIDDQNYSYLHDLLVQGGRCTITISRQQN